MAGKFNAVVLAKSPWTWMSVGLCFAFVFSLLGDEPRSPYAWAEYVLYATMAAGLFGVRGLPIKLSRRVAPFVYVILVLLFGAIYECSLTVDGTGIGGMHPQTFASFVLAFGDYLMIAVVALCIIRWTRAGFRDMFFYAGGSSLTEGLIFTGMLTALLLSPMIWATPFALAYYVMAYASFVALPLLIIEPSALWSERTGPRAIWWYWIVGFGVSFVTRIVWGLGYGPLVEWVFNLPPDIM